MEKETNRAISCSGLEDTGNSLERETRLSVRNILCPNLGVNEQCARAVRTAVNWDMMIAIRRPGVAAEGGNHVRKFHRFERAAPRRADPTGRLHLRRGPQTLQRYDR